MVLDFLNDMKEFERFSFEAAWCNDNTADLYVWCRDCNPAGPYLDAVLERNDDTAGFNDVLEAMLKHNRERHAEEVR